MNKFFKVKGKSLKDRIIIRVQGGQSWIGGVYYKKNFIFSMLQSKKIMEKYDLVICTTPRNERLFESFKDEVIIKVFPENKVLFELFIVLEMLNKRNRYLYCMNSTLFYHLLGGRVIYWIPDFQFKYYPSFFDNKQIEKRNKCYTQLSKTKGKIVLSSKACKDDYIRFFGNNINDIYVVPFVSCIEEEIKKINDSFCKETLEKYQLEEKKYVYIPNQFWQHKNHIVVFDAIKCLVDEGFDECVFVFTGELSDFRHPEYIEIIREKFEDPSIQSVVKNLKFIPRLEQIVIMKEAQFLIQPSLFEGWGTVLEDAKVLDKTVLLSDIPVHREQQSSKCILFNPLNSSELALLIKDTISESKKEDIGEGLKHMKENALLYSKEIEKLFDLV